MKNNILLIILVTLLSACSSNTQWKVVEIEDLCSFEIPKPLECDDNNEFLEKIVITNKPHMCKLKLNADKAAEQNVLEFVTKKNKKMPYKIAITIDQRDDFSERYAQSIMNISESAIPYLEKNLLGHYMKFENIDEDSRKDFDWMPIRVVEKNGMRYTVIEYRMPGPKKELVRVVHSIFLLDGKRIIFSIYCDEKYLIANEDKYMRFIESVSFKNLKRNEYNVYSDININYTFKYPSDFKITENNNSHNNLGYFHDIRLRTNSNTIDIVFYDKFTDNTLKNAKNLFIEMFNEIIFSNVQMNKIKKKGFDTKYFEFDTNGKEYFKGNGLVIEGMHTTIVNAIMDKDATQKGNEAMGLVSKSIHYQDCTYACLIP